MCEFFPTEKCWQRARWQGWNEHSVCYVPGVHCAARTADPGLNIYSPSCVHLCMFVCVCVTGKASVDLRALQGCEARSSKRQKIPAAFGLVSASRKPGTVLHVHVLSPKLSPWRIILFISFYFSVRIWNTTPLIQWQLFWHCRNICFLILWWLTYEGLQRIYWLMWVIGSDW